MRKTEDYFLRTVASIDDLALPVAERVRQSNLHPETIIVIPPQEYLIYLQNRFFTLRYGQRTTPERTLVFGEDRLLVIERNQDLALAEKLIRFENLVHIELTLVLLYAYVTFTWIDGAHLERLKIEYNSVGDSTLRAVLRRLRMTLRGDPGSLMPTDWASILLPLPLKFGNYLQYALCPGERVLTAIFQPAVDSAHRWFRSRLSLDRTFALTIDGMIVLEDASQVLNYGLATRYLPYRSIRCVRFESTSDCVWLRLSLGAGEIAEETAMPLSQSNATLLYDALREFAPRTSVTMETSVLSGG